MNKALKTLKEGNPTLFNQFVELLAEDLGLDIESSAGSLRCPNCHTDFRIALSQTAAPSRQRRPAKARNLETGGKRKRKWNPKPNSLFSLLVKLARIKRTTTGTINAEFNNAMKSKIKGLGPAEVKKIKTEWVADQVAKKTKTRAA